MRVSRGVDGSFASDLLTTVPLRTRLHSAESSPRTSQAKSQFVPTFAGQMLHYSRAHRASRPRAGTAGQRPVRSHPNAFFASEAVRLSSAPVATRRDFSLQVTGTSARCSPKSSGGRRPEQEDKAVSPAEFPEDQDMHERSFGTEQLAGVIRSALNPSAGADNGRDQLISSIKRHFARFAEPPETSLDYYTIGETFSKAEYGRVVRGTHKLTGLPVAIKVIHKDLLKSEKWRLRVCQEIESLRQIRHQSVVQLYDIFYSQRNCLLVTECLGSNTLLSLLREKNKLSEAHAKLLFRQVVEGVMACHDQGIVHRDLRLDNVLVDEEVKVAKIREFGCSLRLKKGHRVLDQCGAPAYLAPETLLAKGYEGAAVDQWSLGVLLYALVAGAVPFRAHSLIDLHKAILKGAYTVPSEMSAECADLVHGLLQTLPQNRTPLTKVLQHPWLKDTESRPAAKTQKLIDEFVVHQVEAFGFPRPFIISSLRNQQVNHATATYFLLLKSLRIAR